MDTLIGGDGADSLDGGAGSDQLSGDAGNDRLVDYLGDNTLDGGAGDDVLAVNGSNNDVLTGGDGADSFELISYYPILNGTTATTTITDFTPGVDKVIFQEAFDVLDAAVQDGNDVVITFAPGLEVRLLGVDLADLTADDFRFGNPITGTEGDDSITGTTRSDRIEGLGGDDILIGNGGNDTLIGGDGNDRLVGGFGNDSLDGGAGDDVLAFGTVGTDHGSGGDGADVFSFVETVAVVVVPDGDPALASLTTIDDFTPGTDLLEFGFPEFDVAAAAVDTPDGLQIEYSTERGVLLVGLTTADLPSIDIAFVPPPSVTGTEGPDVLVGTDATDVIDGLGGDDVISAKGGDDTVDGGAGNDTVFGGAGNDTLSGGDGNDLLIGRQGDDVMTGGAGADVFGIHIPNPSAPQINSLDNYGTDTIIDFESGVDTVRFAWTEFDVLALATQSGNEVVINYATGSTLVFQNTTLTDLSSTDFVFDSTPVDDPGIA